MLGSLVTHVCFDNELFTRTHPKSLPQGGTPVQKNRAGSAVKVLNVYLLFRATVGSREIYLIL